MAEDTKDTKSAVDEKSPAAAPSAPAGNRVAQACKALGLDQKRHVLAAKEYPDRVVIVTNGGSKLTWPGDEEKAARLTERQKDGIPQDTPHRNVAAKARAAAAAEAKR